MSGVGDERGRLDLGVDCAKGLGWDCNREEFGDRRWREVGLDFYIVSFYLEIGILSDWLGR